MRREFTRNESLILQGGEEVRDFSIRWFNGDRI